MIRVVYVKSKTLYEEDGEDMYEKDLLYITTYMYMILSLHELITRCHLVHFCFYCHPVHSKFTTWQSYNFLSSHIKNFICRFCFLILLHHTNKICIFVCSIAFLPINTTFSDFDLYFVKIATLQIIWCS